MLHVTINIFNELKKLLKKKIIFPIHPTTKVRGLSWEFFRKISLSIVLLFFTVVDCNYPPSPINFFIVVILDKVYKVGRRDCSVTKMVDVIKFNFVFGKSIEFLNNDFGLVIEFVEFVSTIIKRIVDFVKCKYHSDKGVFNC